MRFDWTDLRVFLHACDAGSMTQAADRSNLTLAAVSARIRALEDSAGVLLLRRHARGVAATPAGEALARHARLLFHQLDALRRDVVPAGLPGTADTLVLANSSAMARPLARVIGNVLGRHAGGRVVARESSSEVTVHALHAGTAHVGLVSDAVDTQGLAGEILGADPLVLLAPPGHALARRGPVRFEEALSHEWVGWGEDSALHTHLAVRACRAGAALKVKVSLPGAEGVLELVARGLGVSVLPRALLHRRPPGLPLEVVPLEDAWAQRRLMVCRKPETEGAIVVALCNEFKAQWARLEPSRDGVSP